MTRRIKVNRNICEVVSSAMNQLHFVNGNNAEFGTLDYIGPKDLYI